MKFRHGHCVKSVRIASFSGPYFPGFGTEKLRIYLFIFNLFNVDKLTYIFDI